MVTTTLHTLYRKKNRCLFLSYEKQGFYKGLDCGERICSTGWFGLMALVEKMHLQDKPWLMTCRPKQSHLASMAGGTGGPLWRCWWRPPSLTWWDPHEHTNNHGSR